MSLKFQTLHQDEENSREIEPIREGDQKFKELQKTTRSKYLSKPSIKKYASFLLLLLSILLLAAYILNSNLKPKQPSLNIPLIDDPKISHIPQVFSLRNLCDATVWQPKLYLNCTNLAGGTFNVRNSIITCLRWAIDAGMTVLMPRIATRGRDSATHWYDSWENMTYLFDDHHMIQTLQEECPQLVIKETNYPITNKLVAEIINWKQYTQGAYRSHVYDLLAFNNVDINLQSTVIVEDNPLWGWDFTKERDKVHKTLMNTVQFSPHLIALASPIVVLLPVKFVGLHLRVEPDFPWFSFESIVSWFSKLFQDNHSEIKFIYVAVGSKDIEERFRTSISSMGVTVISKWSLAAQNQTLLAEMNSLRFDQLALIDYEILRRSNHFFGVGQSSFAYAIAFERGNGNMTNCNCDIFERFDPYFVCCY
jgi:hypothetical protein